MVKCYSRSRKRWIWYTFERFAKNCDHIIGRLYKQGGDGVPGGAWPSEDTGL